MVCVTGRELDEAGDHEHADGGDEEVGRERKGESRLPHAAEIREDDENQAGERRGDLGFASDGRNDVIAKIPAEIETATVST